MFPNNVPINISMTVHKGVSSYICSVYVLITFLVVVVNYLTRKDTLRKEGGNIPAHRDSLEGKALQKLTVKQTTEEKECRRFTGSLHPIESRIGAHYTGESKSSLDDNGN